MMMLKLAWRNLLLHRKKSAVALLSIATAFVSLSLFEGYIHDIVEMYDDTFSPRQMLGDVIIERKDVTRQGKSGLDAESMSPDEQEWIDQYFGANAVQNRVRFLNIGGIIASARSSTIFIGLAYDPDEGAKMRAPRHSWNTFAGSPLATNARSPVALLGRGLADVLGCTLPSSSQNANALNPGEFSCPSSTVQLQVNTESGQANAMDFEILGLAAFGFAEIDARLVMLPLAEAAKLYNTHLVSYITLDLEPWVIADDWVKAFNAAAQKAGLEVNAFRWQEHEFGEIYLQSMDFLNVFKGFVIAIVLLVVAMAVMNTFVKIVDERLREIGTMRSIGFRPFYILSIFCFEAILLAIGGSALGIILSIFGAAIANSIDIIYNAGLLTEGIPFRIQLAATDFIWISGVLIILALISTIVPVWRATYNNIATILAEK